MPDSFDYTTGTNSENVRLLQALIDEAPEYTEETNSRNANILKSIINNTEYTDAPQSEIEELLLRLKAKIGGEIEVDELNVTENGTYDAGVNKAYNPVTVELPLSSKTITENGTYTASSDNLAGFNEVTVAVEGYAKKSIANTPTPIATFNASALPMPSLTVGIVAVQSGSGDPSPTNIRPISGCDEVNVYDTGVNVWDEEWVLTGINANTGAVGTWTDRIASKNFIPAKPSTSYYIKAPSTAWYPHCYDKDKNWLGRATTSNGQGYVEVQGIFTTLPNTAYIKFSAANNSYGTTYNNDISINYPSTDTSYHAYSGQTYTTTIKDGQGNSMTCYGGTLSNENGVQRLTNGMGIVDLGKLNWVKGNINTAGTGRIFYVPLTASSPMKQPSDNGLCEALKYNPFSNWIAGQWERQILNGITVTASSALVVCVQDIYETASDFKTAMSGVMFAYELATPQQIPQDSLSIATQEGVNNLWADSGDVQSGEYFVEL